MKNYALFLCVHLLFLSGCEGEFFIEPPEKKPVKILSVEILKKGEPDGYRGKAIKIVASEKLGGRTITYDAKITTKNSFEVSGTGYLSSFSSPHPPTDVWFKNMYLWVPRDDASDLWRIITEEVRPGNIESVKIVLFENGSELDSFIFSNL